MELIIKILTPEEQDVIDMLKKWELTDEEIWLLFEI
jgi:hypothetical protein